MTDSKGKDNPGISGIKAVDDLTTEFTLTEADGSFPRALAMGWAFIRPAKSAWGPVAIAEWRSQQIMETLCGLGQIRFGGFRKRLKPCLIGKRDGKPVGRDAVLCLDDPPDMAFIGASLRRERGGRPHSRKRSVAP